MKRPFVPVFLACLTFLYLCHRLEVTPEIPGAFTAPALCTALVLGLARKWRPMYWVMVFALALLVSGQFLSYKENFSQAAASPVPGPGYVTLKGRLADFPELREDQTVLELETLWLQYEKQKIFRQWKVRVTVNGGPGALGRLARGSEVILAARLYPHRFNRNFFPNPMAGYYLERGIHFKGSCKSARLVAVEKQAPWAWEAIGKWRNAIRRLIEQSYPNTGEHPDRKGVFLQAILLGDRGKLREPVKETLINAGVYHLLAISGAHIGVIALFCLVLLRGLGVPVRSRYLVTAVVLLLFLVLSGFKVSAERAVFMAVVIFAARFFYLEVDIYNIIAFCGFVMLARHPAEFLDAGFILTVALTAAIVMGRDIFLPLLGRVRWGRGRKLPDSLKEFLSANGAAFLAALPLSVFFFKRYSFAGFLSGLVLLPVTAIITAGGILLLPAALLWPGLGRGILWLLNVPLEIFFQVAGLFSRGADFFCIYRASPPVWLLAVMSALFYFLSLSRSWKQKIVTSGLLFLGALYIVLPMFPYAPDHLEVFYLDVGQGDAAVVVFPGGDGLLIDGGGSYFSTFPTGRRVVLPFLLQKRIRIRWAAVSHFHPDHSKGVAELLHILKPEELWISAQAEGNTFYGQLVASVPKGVTVVRNHAPWVRRIGDCRVELLHPAEIRKGSRPHNNDSQVLKISDGYRSFLFAGDIEKEVESRLSELACRELRAAVLKVPHHGSRTSSGDGLLDCVRPEWAIFSYGWKNRFGFPHLEVKARYKKHRIKSLSTARGGIRMASTPGGLKVETSQ